eukprot:1173866-Prorocentrum_minimum.AAC.2
MPADRTDRQALHDVGGDAFITLFQLAGYNLADMLEDLMDSAEFARETATARSCRERRRPRGHVERETATARSCREKDGDRTIMSGERRRPHDHVKRETAAARS